MELDDGEYAQISVRLSEGPLLFLGGISEAAHNRLFEGDNGRRLMK